MSFAKVLNPPSPRFLGINEDVILNDRISSGMPDIIPEVMTIHLRKKKSS